MAESMTLDQVLGFLRSLAPQYDNNLPNGGAPRSPSNVAITKPREIGTGPADVDAAIRNALTRIAPQYNKDLAPGASKASVVPSVASQADIRSIFPIYDTPNAKKPIPADAPIQNPIEDARSRYLAEGGLPVESSGYSWSDIGKGALDLISAPGRAFESMVNRNMDERLNGKKESPAPSVPGPVWEAVSRMPAAIAPAPAVSAQPAKAASVRAPRANTAATPQAESRGALSIGGYETPDITSSPLNAVAQAEQPAKTEEARKSLGERYRELINQIPKHGGELTDKQKAQLELEFFLGLLARGQQPGKGLLTNIGEAGLDVSKTARAEQEKAMMHAKEQRREAIDEALRQIGFEDKDADNRRADVTQRATEEWRKRQLDLEDKKLKGLMDDREYKNQLKLLQIEMQGKYQEVLGQARLAQIEAATQRAAAAEAKAAADPITHMMDNLRKSFPNETPEQLFQRAVIGAGKGDKGGKTTFDEGDIAGMYRDALKAHATNPTMVEHPGNFAQFKERVMSATGGPQRFNTPAELEAAKKAGKVKAGDIIMTPEGPKKVK